MVTVSGVGAATAVTPVERDPTLSPAATSAVPVTVSASAIAEGGAERSRQMTGRVVQALFEADRLGAESAPNPALFFVERADAFTAPKGNGSATPDGAPAPAESAEDASKAAQAAALADAEGKVEALEEAKLAQVSDDAAEIDDDSESALFRRFYSSRQTFVQNVYGTWGPVSEATNILVSDFDNRMLSLRIVQDTESDDAGSDATFLYISSNGRYRGSMAIV